MVIFDFLFLLGLGLILLYPTNRLIIYRDRKKDKNIKKLSSFSNKNNIYLLLKNSLLEYIK